MLSAAGFGISFGISYANRDTQLTPQTASIVESAPEPSKYEVGPPTKEELLELINQERQEVGVEPLVVDADVQIVAQMKADDMVDRNYFSHNLPGSDRILSAEMVAAHKGKCHATSENIRQNGDINTSQAAFDAWKRSDPHYQAMISAEYTYTGLGVNGATAVQHFCIQD